MYLPIANTSYNNSYVQVRRCSYGVCPVSYKIARTRAIINPNSSVRIQISSWDREIIRTKLVHSRFREQMARVTRKHPDSTCCLGPAIKALNCCVGTADKKVSNKHSRLTKCISLKTILNGFQNSFYLSCSLILTGETGL